MVDFQSILQESQVVLQNKRVPFAEQLSDSPPAIPVIPMSNIGGRPEACCSFEDVLQLLAMTGG